MQETPDQVHARRLAESKPLYRPIKMRHWGSDHWSLLAYLYHCQVNTLAGGGLAQLRHAKVRCNDRRHPIMHQGNSPLSSWRPEWGTRLAKFHGTTGKPVPRYRVADHDDWDIMADFEAYGLMEIHSTVNGFFRLTEEGMALAHEVNVHKGNGGVFATFVPKVMPELIGG